MWRLKIAEGGKDLVSANNFVGRQHWEFNVEAGTTEERAHIEALRHNFKLNRFRVKQSVELLMRLGSLNAVLGPEHQKETIQYNHQNEEGHNTMLGTALSNIELRILGEGPEDHEDRAMVARGRQWILDHGGLVAIPS